MSTTVKIRPAGWELDEGDGRPSQIDLSLLNSFTANSDSQTTLPFACAANCPALDYHWFKVDSAHIESLESFNGCCAERFFELSKSGVGGLGLPRDVNSPSGLFYWYCRFYFFLEKTEVLDYRTGWISSTDMTPKEAKEFIDGLPDDGNVISYGNKLYMAIKILAPGCSSLQEGSSMHLSEWTKNPTNLSMVSNAIPDPVAYTKSSIKNAIDQYRMSKNMPPIWMKSKSSEYSIEVLEAANFVKKQPASISKNQELHNQLIILISDATPVGAEHLVNDFLSNQPSSFPKMHLTDWIKQQFDHYGRMCLPLN